MTDDGRQISDDELIGAMHDGELSAVDRARAERLLASDPARRRELAELAELSGKLQALPRASLGEGFAAEVLRRAEREMLTTARSTPVDEPTTSIGLPRRWLPQGRRPWLWAGAALAASVVIMLLAPPDRQQVAQQPEAISPVALTTAEHESTRDAAFAPRPIPAVSAPMSSPMPAAKAAPESPISPAPPAANLPLSAPAGAAAMPAQSLAAPGAQLGAANATPANESLHERQVASQLESFGYGTLVNRHLAQQATVVETLNRDTTVDDTLVVVEVDVDRRQLETDPFAQVLLDNGIQSATVPQVQRANLTNNLQQSQVARSRGVNAYATTAATSDTDLVYVLAGADQLQQTIAQLQAGSNTYRRVVVRGGTSPTSVVSEGIEQNRFLDGVEKTLKEKRVPADKQSGDGAPAPSGGAKSNVAREADSIQRKATNEPQVADTKPAAPAGPNGMKKDQVADEKREAGKRAETDKLAKQAAQQRSRGWFGRLTLPPADALPAKDAYFTTDQRSDPRQPASERGEVAKSPESKLQVANPTAGASGDRARLAEDMKAKGELSADKPTLPAIELRSAANGEPPLQRALFVFRVVDGPESAASPAAAAQTPAASKPVPAGAPAASPSPPQPAKPAEPKSLPEAKP
ncbi:MAG: hypothetical protein JNM18_25395 [Planctomycetaceae bacterium]|nr:hypothetical protein [Planctomycetaceae bacterium]